MRKESIFELAKALNKTLVFIFFENKVYLTLADKKVDGTLRLILKRKDRTDLLELEISPDQEFLLHTPKIIAKYREKTIFDYILNFDKIEFLLDNPKDVIYDLSPYDVPAIFIVFPHEVLSRETLKNLSLIETGVEEELEVPFRSEEKKTIKLKVLTPTINALDKYTIKVLSMKSKISLIDTLLEILKNIQTNIEGVYKSGEAKSFFGTTLEGIARFFTRERLIHLIIILLVIVMVIGVIYFLPIFANLFSGLGKALTATQITPVNITPTFP
ncbi:MAG: hypothetical protein QXY70_01140 [Nanopusillaceae archaeon]